MFFDSRRGHSRSIAAGVARLDRREGAASAAPQGDFPPRMSPENRLDCICGIRAANSARLSLSSIPLVCFHVDVAVWEKPDALFSQARLLLAEIRREAAGMVHDAVTGKIAVMLGHAEHLPDEAGIALATDQAGDLPVGRDAAVWDLPDDGEDLVNEAFIQNERASYLPHFPSAFIISPQRSECNARA